MLFLINVLTLSRIFSAVVIFLLLTQTNYNFLILFLFIFSGISDYLDGFLARKYNKTSSIGEILDPIADKILVIFILIGLSIKFDSYLIGFNASLIISREILVSAIRDYNSREGKSYLTKVTFLAKTKTAFQFFTISIYLIGVSFNNMFFVVIGDILIIMSSLITLYTGYQYFYSSFANRS